MKYGNRVKGRRLTSRSSKRMFSRVAQYVHPYNIHTHVQRGGFRL